MIGLIAVAFVQVCPAFDDPTPLAKVRQHFMPPVVVVFLLSVLWLLRCFLGFTEQRFDRRGTPVFDLTCTRLC